MGRGLIWWMFLYWLFVIPAVCLLVINWRIYIEFAVQVYYSRYSLSHMFLVYLIRLHAARSLNQLARLPNRLADCCGSHPQLPVSNLMVVVIAIHENLYATYNVWQP